MNDLQEIEAIKQLKYRYFRFLDTKKWDDLGHLSSVLIAVGNQKDPALVSLA